MRSSLALAYIFLAIGVVPTAIAQERQIEDSVRGQLVLSIELSKSSYIEGEPVWMLATILNETNRDTSVIPLDMGINGHFVLNVTYNDTLEIGGNRMWVCGGEIYDSSNLVRLQPGEKFSRLFDLSADFGRGRHRLKGVTSSFSPGNYNIDASYHFYSKSHVVSNASQFTILPVPNAYEEIWDSLGRANEPGGVEKVTRSRPDLYHKIIEDHGNLPWIPTLLREFAEFFDRDHAFEYCLLTLTHYPDSPYCDLALVRLSEVSGTEGLRRALKHVIDPPPNTRLSTLIQQLFEGKITMPLYSRNMFLKTSRLDLLAQQLARATL